MKRELAISEILETNIKELSIRQEGLRIANFILDPKIPKDKTFTFSSFKSVIKEPISKSDILKILLLFAEMKTPCLKLHYAISDMYHEIFDLDDAELELYFEEGNIVDRVTGDIRTALDKEIIIYFSKAE